MSQNQDESNPLEHSSRINESRRRRTRRLIVPSGRTERSLYVNEIANRLVPGLDFYLFSMLCALVLGAAILLDHPAIYILAALIAPFMAPLVGLGFSTAVGSFRFLMQSLGSLAIASGFIFLGGLLSGWASNLMPTFNPDQIYYHTRFSFPHLVLLLIGAVLAIYLTVRVPKQRSLVASVALAYEIFIPIGVAGFGLASGTPLVFEHALRMAGIAILLVIMVGAIVLTFLRLRPFTFFGYLMTILLLAAAIYGLFSFGALKSSLQPEQSFATSTQTSAFADVTQILPTNTPPPPTATLLMPVEVTPTNTLVPTRTPTVTNTPKPPEVWATINVEVGVYIRQGPCADDERCPKVGAAVANKTPVQVLAYNDDQNWVQVRLADGREGWVNRVYLTFTP